MREPGTIDLVVWSATNEPPGLLYITVPDAERGHGQPGYDHILGAGAGLVHEQQGEVIVRDLLKQGQHLPRSNKEF